MRIVTLVMVVLLVASGIGYGYGTTAGTVFTNISVQAQYTSSGGAQYSNYATGGMPQVTVATGYDLSLLPYAVLKEYGSAGQWLAFNIGRITNYGNWSANIVVAVMTNEPNTTFSGSGWFGLPIRIYTNGALAATGTDNVAVLIPDLPSGSSFELFAEVQINPGVTPDGSTNMFIWRMADPAGSSGAGDNWPTDYASYWGITPDVANERDGQQRYGVMVVQGPIITLTKTVNSNLKRPFEPIEYTIKYTNSGTGIAQGVSIIDMIDLAYVTLFSNSAENNNTLHAGVVTNNYWNGTWQAETFDDTLANRLTISRVRWDLDTDVNPGNVGYVRFKVIIK